MQMKQKGSRNQKGKAKLGKKEGNQGHRHKIIKQEPRGGPAGGFNGSKKASETSTKSSMRRKHIGNLL